MIIKNKDGIDRKVEPHIKFNNGRGAILCNYCSVIIKENLTKEEFEGKTDLLFCEKHKKLNALGSGSNPDRTTKKAIKL